MPLAYPGGVKPGRLHGWAFFTRPSRVRFTRLGFFYAPEPCSIHPAGLFLRARAVFDLPGWAFFMRPSRKTSCKGLLAKAYFLLVTQAIQPFLAFAIFIECDSCENLVVADGKRGK